MSPSATPAVERSRARALSGIARIGAALSIALIAGAAHAQFPNKPIRIVVGFAAGTGPDLAARIVAQKMQESLGSAVVVENKPGAAGFIAAQEVARAAPDGYTLLFGEVGQLSIAPSTYKSIAVRSAEGLRADQPDRQRRLRAGRRAPKVAATSLKEYVDWAKKQKELFMATFGAGTPGHFGAVVFGDAVEASRSSRFITRATGDAVTGTIGGDVQGMFGTVALTAPYIKSQSLRALAMTGPVRSPLLPDVPTFKELGYPDLEFSAWFGLLAPAKTPPEILDRLNAEIVKAVKSPEGASKLEEAGFRVTGTSREQFVAIIRDETARWAKVVKASGFKALD